MAYRTRLLALPLVLASACLALGGAACSHDEQAPAPTATPTATASTKPTVMSTKTPKHTPTPRPTRTRTSSVRLTSTVHGDGLSASERKRVRAGVTRAVRSWLRGGFLAGPFPQHGYPHAFDAFTPGARAAAKKKASAMTNGARGRKVQSMRATTARSVATVWAPDGKPAGASARVQLVAVAQLTGGKQRTVSVSGTLDLTPTGAGWKIFGFDIDTTARRGGAGR